jgi:hypothetical protein
LPWPLVEETGVLTGGELVTVETGSGSKVSWMLKTG